MRRAGYPVVVLATALLLMVPLVIKSPYVIHLLILAGLYIGLVLGYNIGVGDVGILSLSHATFFGVGGYVAALLSTRVRGGVPLPLELLAAGAVAGTLAFLMGIPCFRLPQRSFAIGTLGFALIVQQVVHNWVSLTQGPMCIVPIPAPSLSIPYLRTWRFTSLSQFYYLTLALTLLILLFCFRLKASRVGRTLSAVRESETLARSIGIDPLKYKMLALVVGAAIAGFVGVLWAHYARIICPSDLSFTVTVNVLIMVFVGGVGSLRGIILGAVVFTALPELLRLTPQIRELLYGVTLLLAALYMPQGLEGALVRALGSKLGRQDGASLDTAAS
jgi:ABC-type branched-subunit amino acid transport system permease subunit